MARKKIARRAMIVLVVLFGLASIGSIAWAMVPRALPAPAMVSPPAMVQHQVDQHIPFDVIAGEKPSSACSPVDLDLLVVTDSQGLDLDYRWRIKDETGSIIECGDFYELYYRCDGHHCYQMRVIRRSETAENEIVSDPVHVCLR